MKFRLFIAASLIAFANPGFAQSDKQGVDMRVILLGTGGPEMSPNRFGYATLVEAGGQKLLFDAGRGVMQRIYESRVKVTSVTNVFFTHLHNDHIEGLPSLWMTPWFLLGRTQPLQVWGPPGTAKMIAGMQSMFAFDMEHRVNQFNKLENLVPVVKEISEGDIYNKDGVKVTAFPVLHGDGDPSFGYRISYKGKNVVLSGDTTYSPNVVKYGRNADLIVHNVIAMSEHLTKAPEMGPILAKLTTPEQAARVFKETAPKMAVFSHIVKKELHGLHGDDVVMEMTRKAGYTGPLEMGYDRMIIEVGSSVRVFQPAVTFNLPDLDKKERYEN
ncbi:MBL fold metallo-hydrolase [Undibacterium arcticum]|uniref:MBL fold metallo-hydrolase n=1 Tax=Undibacterium arcticum TaxID=1762892 RepID=A0ABV7EY78_9BURK